MKRFLILAVGVGLVGGAWAAENRSELDRCIEAQQQAIVELLAAMKNARNVIGRNGKGSSGERNPFRSKMRYELPMLNRGENPEAQLDDVRAAEEQLLREMSEASGRKDEPKGAGSGGGASDQESGSKAKRQAEVAAKLEKMASDKQLSPALHSRLREAAAAARVAESALESNAKDAARNAATKALAEIGKALGDIRERSDRETAASAAAVRRELNRAQRELQSGDRNRAAAALERALQEAANAARRQLGSGRYANAELMNGISRSITPFHNQLFKIDVRRAVEWLRELRKEITATAATGEPVQGMRQDVARLRELVGEIRYLERKKSGSDGDAGKIRDDLELVAQNIDGHVAALSGTRPAAVASLLRWVDASGSSPARNLPGAIPPAEALIREAEAFLNGLTANRRLHLFDRDEAPEEYRRAVDQYFERLSRMDKKGAPQRP